MQTYEQILAAMQARYLELTGFSADNASDIGIRLQVLAQQVHKLYGNLENVQLQAFPQTSTGVYLDHHAEARGLFRKGAQPAAGTLRFSRETASTVDIPIPAGSVCATRPTPQVQFTTTMAGVLAAGTTRVDIPAKAVDLGNQGNVAVAAACLMVSAVPGITAVTNPVQFSGGVDEESDDALRARLLAAYRSISNGCNVAFYRDIALQYEAVSTVNVIPRARGRGTVDVVINCTGISSATETLEKLQQQFDEAREINVDVQVSLAEKKSVSISASVAILEGYDFTTIQANCCDALRRYLTELQVGAPLLVAGIARTLMDVEGVYNCRVSTPISDVTLAANQVVNPSSLSVGRMAVG